MKKIIFIFFLPILIYCQVIAPTPVSVLRGDKQTLTFQSNGNFITPINYSITFVVKASSDSLTYDRLIEKTYIGGKITKTYSNNKTIFVVTLDKEDTQDLRAKVYYYDMVATTASDTTYYKTLARGNFNVIGDVQTPYDGTDLPSAAARYVPILASNFDTGEFIKSNGASFVGDSLLAYLQWSDTTSSIPTKTFLSQNHYTKSQANSLLNAKIAYSDTTSLIPTRIFLSQNHYTKTQANTLLNAKIAYSDTTLLIPTKNFISLNYYTNAATDLLLGAKLDTTLATAVLRDQWSAAYARTSLMVADTSNWHTAYSHTLLTNNPHSVTATQVGLGSVENTALSTWAGTTNIVTTGIFSRTTGKILPNTSTDNLGMGSATTPLHLVTIGSSTAGNLNAFNFVNTNINKSRATIVQARDTSSFSGYFTATGKPQIFLKGFDGTDIFRIDSNKVVFTGVNQATSLALGGATIGSNVLSATGNVAFGTNGLFWDNTNKKLGVGATAPLHKLEIKDTDKAVADLYRYSNLVINTTDAFGIDKGGTIGLGGLYDTVGDTFYNFAAIKGAKENATTGSISGYLSFITTRGGVGSAEWMRITSLGNVFIGYTADPTSGNKFAVNGASYFNGNATFTGNILSGATTNTKDIGATATRFRTGYFGTSIITPAINNGGSNLTIADNIYPGTDNTYYLGKNDDDTPFAYKGLILKDQAGTGKYYRLEVYNDALRIVDLTD